MSDESATEIKSLVERMRSGDETARDELLRCSSERLERLTRKMLRDYPVVRRWEQTDDVLQNALLRLCRALGDVKPGTALEFYRLAALQIRRELLDMARRYSGPLGLGTNHASNAGDVNGDGEPGGRTPDAADDTYDPVRLAEWTRFHDAAGALRDEQREVFDLLYYQGMTQEEAATLLEVSDRTVKRRWLAARLALHDALGGRIPGG